MAESTKKPNVTVDIEKPKEATSRGVTRWDDFEQEMERAFEGFLSRNWLSPFRGLPGLPSLRTLEARLPKVDVIERDGEVVVRAELAGVDKKDLEVSLLERALTIRATTRKEEKEEKGEYYRREISSGEVSRTVRLPADVDGTKAKAEFQDGILEIIVPKLEKSSRVKVDVK